MDPKTSRDGKPYGPKRYKDLVRECWFISDNLHTSYTDVLDISYQERLFLIEFIRQKQEETEKAMVKAQQEAKNKRKQ